jgi:hypothetical protein
VVPGACGGMSIATSWRAMKTFLAGLQAATLAGAGLALASGCSDDDAEANALPPYDLAALGCAGEDHDDEFGFHGQCCVDAYCYQPADDEACVSPDDSILKLSGPDFPTGSGNCGCAVTQPEAIMGPFGENPENPTSPAGSCCYLVGSIGCDGRALLVAGEARQAPVVRRRDWLLG